MKGDAKPAPAEANSTSLNKPAIPTVDPEIEKLIRGADDLGHAAKLLRQHHPELDQGQRLDAIRNVTRRIFAERDRPNARRESIARLARQHAGERHKEGAPERDR